MNFRKFSLVAALMTAACSSNAQDGTPKEQSNDSDLKTQVLTTKSANSSEEEWGSFVEYYSGETAGVSELLSGTATIKPGLEIHPPHRHAEEEFLMVLEGEGEWTIGEETFVAKKGDMLYAAAWDTHGIKNTGETPLTFVFWKWNSKGVPVPVDPEA